MSSELTEEFVPTTQAELARFVAENATGAKRCMVPVGGRTALNYGYPVSEEAILVSTARLNRMVDYPARDMTVTVEAGMRMDELAKALQAENQQLPIDVAQSHRATLGGVVATNTSGPRRYGYGTMRDYVIGISAVDAQGRAFKAGGRVVKNVAGYDLCKMLVGSLGTLGMITQVTLKLRPVPETSAVFWATFANFDMIDAVLGRLLTTATRPVALEVLDAQAAVYVASETRLQTPLGAPVLAVGVEGSRRETEWQIAALQEELAPFGPSDCAVVEDDAVAGLWQTLAEFQTSADAPLTFHANMLPSQTMEFLKRATDLGVTVQAHAGSGVVVGHLADETVTVEQAGNILAPLRHLTRGGRGNLTITHCDPAWKRQLPVFGDSEPSWPLMRALKRQLDPEGLWNPDRFIDGHPGVSPTAVTSLA